MPGPAPAGFSATPAITRASRFALGHQLLIGAQPNGAKISIAFVEDGGELHAFYDGVLSGMDKPWGGVSWLLARNG